MVDPTLHFRPAYPVQQPLSMRSLPPASTHSSTALHIQQNHPQSYLYQSPPRPPLSFPSQYHPSNDYCVGHVLGINSPGTTNYTCIGAPVGPNSLGSTNNSIGENGVSSTMHTSASNGHQVSIIQDDGLSWGMRGFGGTSHQQLQQPARLDLSLAINRFQDRF